MRKFNQFLLVAVFSFTASVLCAQLNVQATRWAVPGKQIDFNNYPATATTLNTDVVFDGINSYTYMDGPMLFQIVDNDIKDASGNILEEIGNLSYWRGAEYATTEVKNDCNTFVTFFIERGFIPEFTTESLCYSKYSRDPVTGAITMTTQGQALRTESQDAIGGIALTQERADGSRFLYYASTNAGSTGYLRRYTVSASGVISGETVLYTTNKPFRMAELELSHDGTRLAFSRIGAGAYYEEAVDDDVVIFEINPTTGGLANPTPHYINLASSDDEEDYPGIEFSADGSKLLVFRAGVGLYEINMSNQ